MKKLFTLGVIQLIALLTYAVTLDNQKLKINSSDENNYLVVPLSDGYLLVSRDTTPSIVRLNAQNQVQWAKTFTYAVTYSTIDRLYTAGAYPDGSFYLIYGVTSNVNDYAHLTVKLNAQGTVQWAVQFEGSYEYPYLPAGSAKPLGDGSLVFVPSSATQMSAVKLNPNGTVASSYVIAPDTTQHNFNDKNPCMDAAPTDDSGMIVIGKDDKDPVYARISPTGTTTWAHHFSCGFYNRPYSIIKTSDANYLVGGLFSNDSYYRETKAFLMKLSPAGNILWAKRYDALIDTSTRLSAFTQLVENPDGSIAAIGFAATYLFAYYPSEYHEVSVTLSSSGQVQSAYHFNSWEYYQDLRHRLYKAADGNARISTQELNTLGTFGSILINPATLSDYCNAHSFTITESTMPAITNLPVNNFAVKTNPTAATHPVITTQDITISTSTKNLCGITGIEEAEAANAFSLSPNPATASDMVTIKWNGSLSAHQIVLRDVSGRLVKQISVSTEDEVSFASTGLLPGLYFVTAVNANHENTALKKLLITE